MFKKLRARYRRYREYRMQDLADELGSCIGRAPVDSEMAAAQVTAWGIFFLGLMLCTAGILGALPLDAGKTEWLQELCRTWGFSLGLPLSFIGFARLKYLKMKNYLLLRGAW